MGKTTDQRLTAKITLRLSEAEKTDLQNFADLANISTSEVIRRMYYGKKLVVNDHQNIIKELRRQGGLLKKLHLETGGAYSELTAATLKQMSEYIEQLRKAEK